MEKPNFATVTEVTGYNVTKEQVERMYTRYRFAAEFCQDKDVLEVACGSGQGLGYLAKKARKVVGGDIDQNLLDIASRHYQGRKGIEIKYIDAQALPFADKSFDLVILYEAVYYLSDPARFMQEAFRALKDKGMLLVCTVNKDWADFNPSPYSQRYFSFPELSALFKESGFKDIKTFGDCRVDAETLKDKTVSLIKKTAVALHLIPKTMKGKELLKRIFMGKLSPLPPEITEGMAKYSLPLEIDSSLPNHSYKVLYALGQK